MKWLFHVLLCGVLLVLTHCATAAEAAKPALPGSIPAAPAAPEKAKPKIHTAHRTIGLLQTNCYVVWAEGTKAAFIIDPGADAEDIEKLLKKKGLKPAAILLTHAHPDHICAVGDLAEKFKIPVWLHAADLEMYHSIGKIMPMLKLPEPVKEIPSVAGLPFTVLETPGHTQGGVSFYFADIATVFSGDTLFCGAIGRTDLAGGNMAALLKSIREKLLTLPAETKVFPGHMGSTTVGEEAKENPFLQKK